MSLLIRESPSYRAHRFRTRRIANKGSHEPIAGGEERDVRVRAPVRPAAGPHSYLLVAVCSRMHTRICATRMDLLEAAFRGGLPLSLFLPHESTNNSRRSAARAHSASITCLHSTCRAPGPLFPGGSGGVGPRGSLR